MTDKKKPQVLIIDKNSGGSFLLTSILKDWGCETVSVNSFLKAVDYCKNSYTPELVIVEMQEAGDIFYEFPHKFLERTGKSIPMLVHSNTTDKNVIMKSIQSGYQDYLVRPVETEILHDKISNIIDPQLKLNNKTFNFKMDEEAKLNCPLHIDSINEFGLRASMPFELSPGMLVNVQSPTLIENGLDGVSLKVVNIKLKEATDDAKYSFLVKLSFVGLKSSELTKLRRLAIFKGDAA